MEENTWKTKAWQIVYGTWLPFTYYSPHRLERDESDRPPSSREVTTLRIKSEKGDQTYVLKMKFSQTIQDVMRHIDKQR